jgi:hypothetical protein
VQHLKTPRPAPALHGEPISNGEQLGSGLDQSNTPKASEPQAPPDDTGESDFDFFAKRPLARHRIRSAFPNEFPDELLKPGGGRPAVVIVAIERDADGRPTTRGRGLVFPEGGSA